MVLKILFTHNKLNFFLIRWQIPKYCNFTPLLTGNNKLEIRKEFIDHFTGLPGDYRAETFASELTAKGISSDKMYFKLMGIFSRPIARDIAEMSLDIGDNGAEQLLIELNREGLYDMLPEGIFHFRDHKGTAKDKQAVLDDIKKAREEEMQARRFFGPMENEFFQLRLQLENKKRSLFQPSSTEDNRDFFESLYGNSSLLNDDQVLALLYILPLAHKIRGDIGKISECIRILLRYDIRIKPVQGKIKVRMNGDNELLGQSRLGIDSVAGNFFHSSQPVYEIHIGMIGKKELKSFFPAGKNYSIVHYLVDFLFPFDALCRLRIHLKEEDRPMLISDDKNQSYLGFNTYL